MYFAYTTKIKDIDDHSRLEKRHGGNQWGSILISSHAFNLFLSLLHGILLIINYLHILTISLYLEIDVSRVHLMVLYLTATAIPVMSTLS